MTYKNSFAISELLGWGLKLLKGTFPEKQNFEWLAESSSEQIERQTDIILLYINSRKEILYAFNLVLKIKSMNLRCYFTFSYIVFTYASSATQLTSRVLRKYNKRELKRFYITSNTQRGRWHWNVIILTHLIL